MLVVHMRRHTGEKPHKCSVRDEYTIQCTDNFIKIAIGLGLIKITVCYKEASSASVKTGFAFDCILRT